MTLRDFLANPLGYVRCPDGRDRHIWGHNPDTGDVFVADWFGDVWLDAHDPARVAVEFDPDPLAEALDACDGEIEL